MWRKLGCLNWDEMPTAAKYVGMAEPVMYCVSDLLVFIFKSLLYGIRTGLALIHDGTILRSYLQLSCPQTHER